METTKVNIQHHTDPTLNLQSTPAQSNVENGKSYSTTPMEELKKRRQNWVSRTKVTSLPLAPERIEKSSESRRRVLQLRECDGRNNNNKNNNKTNTVNTNNNNIFNGTIVINGNKNSMQRMILSNKMEKIIVKETNDNEFEINEAFSPAAPIPAQRMITVRKKENSPSRFIANASFATHNNHNGKIDSLNSSPMKISLSSATASRFTKRAAAAASVSSTQPSITANAQDNKWRVTTLTHKEPNCSNNNTHTRSFTLRRSETRERHAQPNVNEVIYSNNVIEYSDSIAANNKKELLLSSAASASASSLSSRSPYYAHSSPQTIVLVRASASGKHNDLNSVASRNTSASSSPRSLLSSINTLPHSFNKKRKTYTIMGDEGDSGQCGTPFASASTFATSAFAAHNHSNSNNNNNNNNNLHNVTNTLSASHNSLLSSQSTTVSSLYKTRSKHVTTRAKTAAAAVISSRKVMNLSLCRYSLLRIVAEWLSFTVQESEDELGEYKFNLCWSDTVLPLTRIVRFANWQRTNHFPSMYLITRKSHLGRTIGALRSKLPQEYNFYPRTWMMRCEFIFFCRFYEKLQHHEHNKDNNKHAHYFIMKPNAGCQGRGIIVTKDPLNEVEEISNYIVQEYIARPMLIEGRKFDLRVYVLVTSIRNLSIFMFNDGLVRISAAKYEEPCEMNIRNNCIHLTNYAVNKNSSEYVYNTDANHFDVGNKRNFQFFDKWLSEQGHDVALFWKRVSQIVVKTIMAAQPQICSVYDSIFPEDNEGYSCFEVLGFDILVDRNARPWLMEVNHTPSFAIDTPFDFDVKSRLIREVLEIVNCKGNDAQRDKVRVRVEFTKRNLPLWSQTSTALQRPLQSSLLSCSTLNTTTAVNVNVENTENNDKTNMYNKEVCNGTSTDVNNKESVYLCTTEINGEKSMKEPASVEKKDVYNNKEVQQVNIGSEANKNMPNDDLDVVKGYNDDDDEGAEFLTPFGMQARIEKGMQLDKNGVPLYVHQRRRRENKKLKDFIRIYPSSDAKEQLMYETCLAESKACCMWKAIPALRYSHNFYQNNKYKASTSYNNTISNNTNDNNSGKNGNISSSLNESQAKEQTTMEMSNTNSVNNEGNYDNNNSESSNVIAVGKEELDSVIGSTLHTEQSTDHLNKTEVSTTSERCVANKRNKRRPRRAINSNSYQDGTLELAYTHQLLDSRLREDRAHPRYLPHHTHTFLTASFAESNNSRSKSRSKSKSRSPLVASARSNELELRTLEVRTPEFSNNSELEIEQTHIDDNNNKNNTTIVEKAKDKCDTEKVEELVSNVSNHTPIKQLDVVHVDTNREPEREHVQTEQQKVTNVNVVYKVNKPAEQKLVNKLCEHKSNDVKTTLSPTHNKDLESCPTTNNNINNNNNIKLESDNIIAEICNNADQNVDSSVKTKEEVGRSTSLEASSKKLIIHTNLETSEHKHQKSPPQHVRYLSVPTEEELEWLNSLQEQLDYAADGDPIPPEHSITDLTEEEITQQEKIT